METKNTLSEIGLVFAQHKSGSSTVMQALREIGMLPERGYAENVQYILPNLDEYNGVITPVRDPVARIVSYIFELQGDFFLQKKYSLDDIKLELFAVTTNTRLIDFFDVIYKPLFGVDVYATRFPKTKGWHILNDRYILIQTDQVYKKLPDAFEALYGKRPPSIHRAKTALRPYGKLYQEFLDWVKFPSSYLDDMYGQKYVKHFYSVKQVEEMRKRWEEK